MGPFDSLGAALLSILAASDAMYEENEGEPAAGSIARTEVDAHDEELAVATGTDRPLFGAYANCEAMMRSLNDLVRSYVLLLGSGDINVGTVVIARATVETAARMYWNLAVEDDYQERATRWLRERLRVIEEVAKFSAAARLEMEDQGLVNQIRDGAHRAGLRVTGPPPAAIDLVWPLLSAGESPLRIEGLDRETAMILFYRGPSAPAHGALHGTALHFADPASEPSRRLTRPAPLEQTLILACGVVNGYANAQGPLVKLYGWDVSEFDSAVAQAAQRLADALREARTQAQ